MFIIHKTTLVVFLIGTMSTIHTAIILPLKAQATAFASALLCSAATSTACKIIRQASNNSGITAIVEDIGLLQSRTSRFVKINIRKCAKRIALVTALLLLARKTGTQPTPFTTCALYGIAAGSSIILGT